MPREFRLRRRVQFYETDAAGIVHFTWYFRYMEEAEHALWRDLGLSIHPADSDIRWPRVSTSFDYFRPLRFEDQFDVLIRVVTVAERTIRYECLLTCDGETVAAGLLSIACVRKRPGEPMQPIDIPAHVRDLLQ
ncbi:MAG: acyl-CoA thioesterase [Vicinamibacterales bacterium]